MSLWFCKSLAGAYVAVLKDVWTVYEAVPHNCRHPTFLSTRWNVRRNQEKASPCSVVVELKACEVGRNPTGSPRTSCNSWEVRRVVYPHPHPEAVGEGDDTQHFGIRNSLKFHQN